MKSALALLPLVRGRRRRLRDWLIDNWKIVKPLTIAPSKPATTADRDASDAPDDDKPRRVWGLLYEMVTAAGCLSERNATPSLQMVVRVVHEIEAKIAEEAARATLPESWVGLGAPAEPAEKHPVQRPMPPAHINAQPHPPLIETTVRRSRLENARRMAAIEPARGPHSPRGPP